MDPLTLFFIALALNVFSYVLAPKPKAPKSPAAQDMDSPTADAGREVPKVWGTVTIKGINCMGFWDKSNHTYKVKA